MRVRVRVRVCVCVCVCVCNRLGLQCLPYGSTRPGAAKADMIVDEACCIYLLDTAVFQDAAAKQGVQDECAHIVSLLASFNSCFVILHGQQSSLRWVGKAVNEWGLALVLASIVLSTPNKCVVTHSSAARCNHSTGRP